jgi:DNA-binding MarR family transcriptional regulator
VSESDKDDKIESVWDLVDKLQEAEEDQQIELIKRSIQAYIYKALGNQSRIAVLTTLEQDEPVSQLTDELDMTRSGLQKNIERLIDAGLVYRPVDSDQTYSLTPLGEHFVDEIHDEQNHVLQVLENWRNRVKELREEEEETLQRMEDAGVNTKELEQKLQAEAWEDIENED